MGTYLFNDSIRGCMAREDLWALHKIARTLHEAYGRGYWVADRDVVEKIREIPVKIKSYIEDLS